MSNWFTGSGEQTTFDDILYNIREHTYFNGTTYIGTDSFFKREGCVFSTAICLHGADDQSGGKYFICRTVLSKKEFPNLATRMLKEVEKTLEHAHKIIEEHPKAIMELHLDVSSTEKNEGTSHLANMLVGYVKGSGFDCKIKPEAFAAATIADKHTK